MTRTQVLSIPGQFGLAEPVLQYGSRTSRIQQVCIRPKVQCKDLDHPPLQKDGDGDTRHHDIVLAESALDLS
jgi:hypothetical protein